ncbi:dentin sialophosphoprotein, putative (DUF1296) isoform X2 [Tasmannia lanceolata]|uniref:dentin sialophosphoprotein, putative (DUF1296) isoform X2 n=1 Tax=Tasmannia lanceolata TaxID=3420 RepID=UPI004063F2D0
MVSGSRLDGGTQILPARVRKTIQSIKEIVGNHSDADIYVMLKETNMDPNETAQKLLNQDPFHEVKRKRDKKKENTSYKSSTEPRNTSYKSSTEPRNSSYKSPTEPRKHTEQTGEGTKPQTSWDQNARRLGYARNNSRGTGISREFRIVRDNRVNHQNANDDLKPAPLQCSTSASDQVVSNVPEKSSLGILTDQKHSDATNSERYLSPQRSNGIYDSGTGHAMDADSNSTRRQVLLGEKRAIVPNSTLQTQGQNPQNSPPYSSTSVSNNSVVGLYSSSTDPVHVPSPDSRSSGTVGAIKREVGVVGLRRQSSERSVTHSSAPISSFSIPILGKDINGPTESFGQSPSSNQSDQFNQAPVTQSVMHGMPVSRSFLGNPYPSKQHQPTVAHQKASQVNMEWKPKSSQKSSLLSPGAIGAAATSNSSSRDNSTATTVVVDRLPEELSQDNVSEKKNVIIPQHLRVSEADRTQLTFGSFGTGFDSTKDFRSGLQAFDAEDSKDEPAMSISLSNPVTPSEDVSGGDEVDLLEEEDRTSGSESPASVAASEHPMPDKKESSSPRNLDNYANIGPIRSHSPSYSPAEPQLHRDSPGLPSFTAYNPPTGYDMPFFRPVMDENVRGQGLASPQEALSSHSANSVPPSTVAMLQQQPVTPLYPQVHISHYPPNFMPYRQILSPVYPPMAMPSYSSNPAYPHPSNVSSYVLMPGGNSHLTSGSLKYAPSQYKPVPSAGSTGYGNYTNPAGYTMNTPGTVGGGATGLEDVTRIKYKEGNLYVPNAQAETSEIWIQTPRELPNLQSPTYYNLSGQAPHAAYMPSHAGHASFNAPTQSTHMAFPGLYHPSQPATMANPHHLVHQQLPSIGGNVGVAAPGTQVGAYQQPQLGHLNWTPNF